MKKFLAVYIGTASAIDAWKKLDDEQRQNRERAGMQAWGDWMARHAASIVEQGGPLSRTKRISAEGIADVRNAMTGFVIVAAESHEAAARMFEGHPHFAIFPGDSVEVMECLPIPQPDH